MNIAQALQHIEHFDTSAQHRSVPFAAGRSIHWRTFGKGDPLVLIHGGHGSWLHWIRNIDALSRDHALFVPDLPGFGDSDDPPPGSDLQTIVEALKASLDAIFGTRSPIDLAGFSLGGVIAARVAVQRGLVRKLALLGSPGTGTPRRQRAQMIRWRHADAAAQNHALKHNLLAHMMYAEENVDVLAFESYVAAVKATRFRTRGVGGRSSLESILAAYTDPVLFVYGEHDVTGSPELARAKLTGSAPKRQFRLIPGGGHWIQFECATEVNAALASWLHGTRVESPGDVPPGLAAASNEVAKPSGAEACMQADQE